MDGLPVIEVTDLWHCYQPNAWVLSNINLSINRGEFVALVGQNGSGKTTLVKHFNGILKPVRGSVKLDQRDTREVAFKEVALLVGYAYQNPDHQIFNLTVQEELAFGPRNLGLPPAEVAARVDRVLATIGLSGLQTEYPFALSRGQRQKIAVGAILTMNPPVMIIDEPTTGLDWQGSLAMMDLVKELHDQGQTIIMITHDMRIVATYAHRVIVMAQGQILADGTPRELFAQPELLARAAVQAPQTTRIGQQLAEWGMPSDLLTVQEAIEHFQLLLAKAT